MCACVGRSPGRGCQGDDKRLQQAPDEAEGVLACEDEVEQGQQHQAVHAQTQQHRDGVHTQLLPHTPRILHLQDLTRHQEYDPERKVPGRGREGGEGESEGGGGERGREGESKGGRERGGGGERGRDGRGEREERVGEGGGGERGGRGRDGERGREEGGEGE